LSTKILVIGGNSKIGQSLIISLVNSGFDVIKTSRRVGEKNSLFLDLLNVDSFLKNAPRDVGVVVFCASVTKFEECRNNYYNSYEINVTAHLKLSSYFAGIGAKIILLSTSAVFDGKLPFQSLLNIPNSTSAYGMLKAEVEAKFLLLNSNVSILRLSKVIMPGDNIFYNWVQSLRKRQEVNAFFDQYISPISIDLAIKVIIGVINVKENGIFQFSAAGDINYYDAIKKIAEINNLDTNLINFSSAYDSGIPANEVLRYSSLDSERVSFLLNFNPPDSLDFIKKL
jgi:dTDP-4-dehydrorhamnose reductase